MGSYRQSLLAAGLLALMLAAPFAAGQTGPAEAVLVAFDSVNNNDFSPSPANARVSGVVNMSYEVAAGDRLNPDGSTINTIRTTFAFVKLDSVTSSAVRIVFMRFNDNSNFGVGQLDIDTTGKARCVARTTATTVVTTGATTLSAGTWYGLACVLTSTAVEVYVNGVLDGTTANIVAFEPTSTKPANIGGGTTGFTPCDCVMDELRIYSAAVSGANLATINLANILNGTDYRTNLAAWWRFDETWDYGPPTASFVAATFGTNITTDASASHSHANLALNYSWDWGDGSGLSYGANQSHSYAALGTYAVTLTVTEASTGYPDTVVENVTIEATYTSLSTAFDAYIPVILWGGLAFVFLYFTAWAPAIAAMMALGNHLLAAPIWGLPASAMLVLLMLALHVLAVRGIIPTRWGR